MFKDLKKLYCMSVCLVAAVILMIQIPLVIKEGINLGFPESRSIILQDFHSNESFLSERNTRLSDSERKSLRALRQQEVTEKRIEERKAYLQEYHVITLNSFMDSLIWISIAGIFFGIHWILYQRRK